jgi:hypothetical protein
MDTGIYTETLARLYLKQGFIEPALVIYRHLAQEQPENPDWQATIAALEQQMLMSASEQPAVSTSPLAAEPQIPQESTPCCATHVVIAQLERWLAAVRQRQRREASSGGEKQAWSV